NGHDAASAAARGSVGGVVAAVASDSEVTNHDTVTAGIANAAQVTVAGAIVISGLAATRQRGNSSNSASGLVAGGAAFSTTTTTSNTTASIGSSANIAAGSLTITANGTDDSLAYTAAGSRGGPAGSAAAPTTNTTATTTAQIGSSTVVNLPSAAPPAADFTSADGVRNLTSGNTVQAGDGTTYRYVGPNAAIDLQHATFSDATKWHVLVDQPQ